MLIVGGHFTLAPGGAEKVLPAARRLIEETHKEAGCIEYCLARDVSVENKFRLFEIWESRGALDKHMATSHMAEFNKVMGGVKIESISVKIYDVSGAQTVVGE